MMIRDYTHLIGLKHIHMEQMLLNMWKWNAHGKKINSWKNYNKNKYKND